MTLSNVSKSLKFFDSKGWPTYYPIEGSEKEYYDNFDKYLGRYGEMRRNAASQLAEYFKDNLEVFCEQYESNKGMCVD